MAHTRKTHLLKLCVYATTAWLAALWLAWLMLAQVDFLYGVWYEWLDIDRTIAQYAPQNRYRQDFAQTSMAERQRLMSALVRAIHNHGKGLETLRYHDAGGQVLGDFLRPPEILHLRDVAALLDRLRWLGWAAVLAWLIMTARMAFKSIQPPSLSRAMLSLGAVLGVLGAAILLIGPVQVFYQLHVWVFPPGHPWFFYYQDSLLTTLLKAPDIFGPITLSWLLLSLAVLAVLLSSARILERFTSGRRGIEASADQPRTKP